MYRVMIVDDEEFIRDGLQKVIDWEAAGFRVSASASDGVDALEKLKESPVDLILADIRMPRMDGLELLETLRSSGSTVRFLILSGFAEFAYAQKASTQQIDGYLLKPVDEEELEKQLGSVRQKLDAERFSASTLISGVERVPEAYAWGKWQVLLFLPLSASGQSVPLPSETISRLQQTVADRHWGEVFQQPPYMGILLRQVFPKGQNLSHLARGLGQCLGTSVAFFAAAVGEVVDSPSMVPESARKAGALLQQRFFFPPNSIAWESPLQEGTPAPFSQHSAKLALALEAGNSAAIRAVLLLDLGEDLRLLDSEEAVKEALSRVVSEAIERYLGHEARSSGIRFKLAWWIADLWRQPFLTTLLSFLSVQLESVIVRKKGPDTQGLPEKMIDLIEARYQDDLKLDTLAEVLHYNSAYLGKLFRNKTGEYFNTYLDKVRVKHAQELLRQGLKVYQVADLVGYKYVDYFHAKFKKYTGLSPSRFREEPEDK